MSRARAAALLLAGLVLAAAVPLPAGAAPVVDERTLLGESVGGRPIRVAHLGDPEAVRVLVVGCIHGDECAGVGIARRLLAGRAGHRIDLWVLPVLNPDGRAAGDRQNARGVDLNRNFPFRWRPAPPGRYYPGRRPASERETRIAMRLIRRLEPDVTIWYHQPLALVDVSGGDAWVERRYARLVGLPLERLPRYHGTATSWQNHEVGGTAFVVELPSGPLRPREARRHARAVRRLAVLLAGAGDAPSERDRASVRPPERGDRTP